MTFPEQIKGVPPGLVEQGWRREPSREVKAAWYNAGRPHTFWRMTSILVNGAYVDIAQPVVDMDGCPHHFAPIYSHAGWGDGLAPTPEMVKVWKWWWISREDGPQAVKVAPSSAVYQGAFGCTYKVAAEQSLFLGPVLPPVRQS